MAIVAALSDGVPPLWLFALTMALLLPVVAVLMPNSNTAAMMPLPHVAGTAAAVLGTVSTAGGALLGSLIDGRFDGTVEPFAHGVLLYAHRRRRGHLHPRPAHRCAARAAASRRRCPVPAED